MISRLLVLTALILQLQAVSMIVSSMKERCMIVSTHDSEQLLKVDLKFQKFADQLLEEGYRIVLHNT
jgi:predicted deacetylase